MAMRLIDKPSPNHDARPQGTPIDMVVVHYTGMQTAQAALKRLCEAASKVSAHYLIDEDGTLYRLVADDQRAWHAGVSSWAGESDVNGRSIGIELVNPGHEFGYRPFPEPQMRALLKLLNEITRRHKIAPERIVGHSDVAPERKEDPGELFDWARLAKAGFGLWPEDGFKPKAGGGATPGAAELQRALGEIGYGIEESNKSEARLAAAIRAFQRHFRPFRVDGAVDWETARLILHLAERARLDPRRA
jgi:N-acetylmuramoyl-L-alanine amidase